MSHKDPHVRVPKKLLRRASELASRLEREWHDWSYQNGIPGRKRGGAAVIEVALSKGLNHLERLQEDLEAYADLVAGDGDEEG